MPTREEKAFFDKYLTATPPAGNPFKVGDVVIYTNDAGVVFDEGGGQKVLGFFKPEHVANGRTMTLEAHHKYGPLPHWFGCRPENLKKA